MAKNILIIEAYTDANVGSCSLVENAIKLLRDMFPGAHIRIMAHEPAVFTKLYGVDAIRDVFEYPFLQPRWRQLLWLVRTTYWMAICWIAASILRPDAIARRRFPYRRKLEPFLRADLVISVGAERINDKYPKNVVFSLYTYALMRKLGKTFVVFPSTIGPFLFGWSRFIARRVLGGVDLIFARDSLSEKLARELIGSKAENVVRAYDVAVLQSWMPENEARAMIPARPDERIVGISAMRWSYFRNRVETPYSNYEAYLREMALLADALMADYGVKIVLYPTNFPVHGCREDDLTTAFEIKDRMKRKSDITVVESLPTPAALKGMLACSELNFTTRMHACIFSTGAAVPTISINYLFKVREYMRSLGLEDFSVDIEEFNARWALDAFERMWPEREKWRAHIRGEIGRAKNELLRAMERVHDLF